MKSLATIGVNFYGWPNPSDDTESAQITSCTNTHGATTTAQNIG